MDNNAPVSLSKKLNTDEQVSLRKQDGTALTRVRMALGWQVKKITTRGWFGKEKTVEQEVDLDGSIIMVGGGRVLDIVFYNHKQSKDRSITYYGDNVTGRGKDGDDKEIIDIDLAVVSPQVDHLVYVVTSYSGDTFGGLDNAFVRAIDMSDNRNTETARYSITNCEPPTATAMVMGVLSREGNGWTFKALGRPSMGKYPQDLQADALRVC